MKLEELKTLISALVEKSEKDNYLENTETIVKAVIKYRDSGGSGISLNKFVIDSIPQYENDVCKEEVLSRSRTLN